MTASVLVISEDPVGAEMGGNAIRAYEVARALSEHAEVTLAAPASGGAAPGVEHVPFDRESPRELGAQLRGIDVVVTLPQNPVITSVLRRSRARIVYDLYDPKVLQSMEAHATSSTITRQYWSTITLDHLLEALSLGDYFMCASERQRDLWIGAMLAARLITPAAYELDPTLRSLIDVVPFGIGDEAPHANGEGAYERFPSLQRPAEVVLWNGGLWNWLDPVGAVEAIARVIERRPRARLVFMARPPLGEHDAKAALAARARAEQLGLVDRVVFFNDHWVPYGTRADWLLNADCGLSLHLDHLETRFSFRTRLLDCLWTALPVVCTVGDELAERVEREGLGASVAPGDPDAAAEAIVEVLDRGRAGYRDALERVAREYRWPRVVAPLLAYLESPIRPHATRPPTWLAAPGRWARASGTRAVRMLLRSVKRPS